MFGIGSQELLIIFLVVLLLFGAERIPEVARAVGKSMREFKRAAGEFESELQQVTQQKKLSAGKSSKRPGGSKGHPGEVEPLPDVAAKGEPEPPPEAPSENSVPRPPEGD